MEPIKIFLDTNIVLDYYTGRQNDGLAEKILRLVNSDEYRLCISVLTGINCLYVLRHYSSLITMEELSNTFVMLPVTETQWTAASYIEIEDPEDALQIACAKENGCMAIITRDKHILSLKNPGFRCFSPESFLNKLSQEYR